MSEQHPGPDDERPSTAIRPGQQPPRPPEPAPGQAQSGRAQPGQGQPGQAPGHQAPSQQPFHQGGAQQAAPQQGAPHQQGGGQPPYQQPFQQQHQQEPYTPTQQLPVQQQNWGGPGGPGGFQPSPAPREPKRGRGAGIGLLAGALVLGAGAGFGGAVLQDETSGSSNSGSGEVDANQIDTGGLDLQNLVSVQTVADKALPAVVKIEATGGGSGSIGSGVVISDDGEILTNYHVVHFGETGDLTVYFNDGSSTSAEIVGSDPTMDIALLKVEGVEDLDPMKFGASEDVSVGQAVVAVGSPYGLDATVTAGIVSTLNRPVSVASMRNEGGYMVYPGLQTDAAINPGNSGGALVNIKGELVGINSANKLTESPYSRGDGGNIGIGWAIPVSVIQPVLEQIRAGETPTHAWLGVQPGNERSAGIPQGARVEAFESGSAAESAGVEVGDIITAVGDWHVSDALGLITSTLQYRPGDQVTLTVERDGEEQEIEVTMGENAELLEGEG